MFEWPLDLQYHLRVWRRGEIPERLVLTPLRSDRHPTVGLVSAFGSESEEFWVVGVKPGVSELAVATLLAAVSVARDVRILVPVLHPRAPRQPHACVHENLTLFGTRWERFPEAVQTELRRAAAVLLSEHPAYVRAVLDSLSGRRQAGFEPLPTPFVFSDPAGEASLAPLPPQLPIDRESLKAFDDDEMIYRYVAGDYRGERYLKNTPDAEVEQRIADTVVNLMELEAPGKMAVQVDDPRSVRWLARMTEAMEEMRLRTGGGSNDFEWSQDLIQKVRLPDKSDEYLARAADAVARVGVSPKAALIRYGELRYMRDLYEDGSVLIRPASYYWTDKSLDPGRRDNELEHAVELDPIRTRFTVLDEDGREELTDFRPMRAIRTTTAPDFYVYCLSQHLSTRMFLDFARADACVIMHNPEEFIRRLAQSMAEVVPDWRMIAGRVRYYDPFEEATYQVGFPLHKHFAYEYQREFRVAWMPPRKPRNLPAVSRTLGSLRRFAELITL